jgi:Protein of unknown function (DUF1559)
MSPLIIAALVLAAPAPTEDFGAARAKVLAPYIDEQTQAIVRLDQTKIDADAMVKLFVDLGALEPGDEKELGPLAARRLSAFKKAGGRDWYYVYSLADKGTPFIVVPLGDGADVKALTEFLNEQIGVPGPREKVGAALIAGTEKTLERLRKMKPTERPDLAKAFAAAGDGAVQAVFLPSPHLVKLIDENVPDLPKQLGGASTKPFTEGVQWAAFGLDAPPKFGVHLTVRSASAESAAALNSATAALMKAIVTDKEIGAALPGLDKVVPLLVPMVESNQLVLKLDDKQTRVALGLVLRWAISSAAGVQASVSLKQLVLAAHNYADTNGGSFPAVANFDKAGKPLLSWRVHLLPYLEEEKLYKEFHLDEPWDSDHNKKLIAKMPAVFRNSSRKLNEQGKTVFLAPAGKGTAWPGGAAGARFPASFPDGTSNTILLVLADDAHAVEWTKPDDLKIDPAKPHAGLGQRAGVFLVGLADGSARSVKPTISKETLLNAFDPADGNPLGEDW